MLSAEPGSAPAQPITQVPTVLPIAKADAARAKGVTRGAVTHACEQGGQLHDALLSDGRIDSGSEAYKAWLSGKAIDRAPTKPTKSGPSKPAAPTRPTAKAPKAKPAPTEPQVPAPKDISELEDLKASLAPLVEKFGTVTAFKDWLAAIRAIETILEKHLSNEQAMGRLISHELVQAHVTGALVTLCRKLLTDAPKTIARRLAGHFASKGTVEEAERIVRENLGSQINPVKAKVVRVLRTAADV